MMKRFYSILLIAWLACLMAVAQGHMFKRLEVKDGLPNNHVNSIFKDSEGFMWFGTASGLARYDGYEFKVYRSVEEDSTSLPDNFVERISEDAEGRLWVRTERAGITFYDRRTESFCPNVRGYMQRFGIDGVPQLMTSDRVGCTWFYVLYRGIYRYTPGTGQADAILMDDAALPSGTLTDMVECSQGILLVYNNGLVACVDAKTMRLRWKHDYLPQKLGMKVNEVFTAFVDADDDVWIYGVYGMWVLNPARKEWQSLEERGFSYHHHRMVRAVAQDKNGKIWIGKDQDGIDIIDKRDGKVVSLRNDVDDERSLPNNTVLHLYRDPAGMMWAGTYKKGVAYYDESIFKFRLHSLGDVNVLAPDGKGDAMWVGLNDGGLLHFDPATGAMRHYKSGGANSPAANTVVSLLYASDGRLWIGYFWGGLDCYDGRTFRNYRHREGDANSLANNNVWTLAEDAAGNIWIGTLGGGVQRLNPATGQFTNYTSASCGLASDHISSVCMGPGNTLVVGTASQGISLLDIDTGKVVNLTGNREQTRSFSNQNVNEVLTDSRGLIWIATRDGLNLYDPLRDKLKTDFLAGSTTDRFVSGIVEDKNHNMWVTTSNGLINIVIDERRGGKEYSLDYSYRYYDHKDGLQGSEFNQRSITLFHSGSIVMGGLYGLNSFNPDELKYNRMPMQVRFTGFQLFNQEVRVGKAYDGRVVLREAIGSVERVVLNYSQNVFTVLFAADNYALPDKTTYYYRLDGFDKEWLTSPPEMHRATYTNLAPGTYTLRVRAVNSDGMAGSSESHLTIVIRPPFWLTGWAYLCYALLAIGVLFFSLYLVQRRERKKFRIRQKEQEVQKQEELNQMKFRFFTNVSHELRTPLTLIISPLEGMMKQTTDPHQQQQLTLMHRNAQRLLNLVNQLLDFRKNEMVGLHLTLAEGDLVAFVRNICSSFLMLSEKENVHLTFYSSIESLNMAFDEDKLGKVVMNLLSNAFKFTLAGGRVDVALEVSPTHADRVLLKVSDTGIGIKDEDKERVFERFYQADHEGVDNPSTGSGIGLSLVRDFVTMHGGQVRVVDNATTGSVFLVELPVKHLDARQLQLAMPAAEAGASDTDALPPASDAVSDASAGLGEAGGAAAESPADRAKPLALVVDDNADLLLFMKDSLSLYFRVRTAANGQEAWQQIPDQKPDIIVSDVMMPEMDGNELCRWVKSDPRTQHIPLILLTARQALEDKVEGLTIGADDYVTKPFNVEVLVLRMKKLIDLSRKRAVRTRIDPEPSQVEITPLDEQLVAKAIKYVEDNIERTELSVEELSSALGMSRVHLYKKLVQITGKAPIEFIRVIRLKRAAQLLRGSQLNIAEVAYRVGFSSPKSLTKYFREEFGVLPSAYQEKGVK